jgi:hypothetical protein
MKMIRIQSQKVTALAKNNFLNLSATENSKNLKKKMKKQEKSVEKTEKIAKKNAHYFEFIGINYSNRSRIN